MTILDMVAYKYYCKKKMRYGHCAKPLFIVQSCALSRQQH